MKARDSDQRLKAANPFPSRTLTTLEIDSAEAALQDAIAAEPAGAGTEVSPAVAALSRGRRRPRAIIALAGGLAATAAIAILLLAGGNAQHGPSRAYGAELVRFAESTPLLLLEGPNWRVQNASEERRRRGVEGSMEFATGKPIPYESVLIAPVGAQGPGRPPKAERESGMFPPAVRQRRVELFWRQGSLAEAIATQRGYLHPHGQRWIELPVLGTTAHVDTRAEFYVNQGGPGNRQMVALWSEGGYLLELRAAVPSQAAFEERLGWLTKVDLRDWLDAMPEKVVAAADQGAVIREMLKGIPTPSTFDPSQVRSDGLTTDRYQVGVDVTATVSCLWFLQWAKDRRTGDHAAEREAEKAMATSRRWRILREMAKEGAYSETIWELAAEMPSGYREYAGHRWRLLPQAEALGCARRGLPLLPGKQKLQRERGVPLPPR